MSTVRRDGRAWTNAEVAHLRRLRAEGHAEAEICRRLGRSEGSVRGKAHKLGLPSAPQPVRPPAAADEARRRVPTLAELQGAPP